MRRNMRWKCRFRSCKPYLARPDFYAAMDAANIDLKGFTEDFYWKVTGTHLADVLATIDYAVNEARTPRRRTRVGETHHTAHPRSQR